MTALAALVLAAPAAALPGDPQPVPLSPADGAQLAPAPDGIRVEFTCPNYRSSTAEDAPTSDYSGYIARFSRDPNDLTAGDSDPAELTGDQRCAAVFTASTNGPAVPGRVYWRVDRSCYCADGAESESGPVRSFVIRASEPALRTVVQRRAYAGYAIEVGLRASKDVRDGADAVLERRRGGRWVIVGESHEVTDGRATADVTLGRGSAQLRWSVVRGDQVDHGRPATVRVVRPAHWSTDGADDGRYAGHPGLLEFRVAKHGREIRDFKANVSTFCAGPTSEDNRVITSYAPVALARVAPDGRFLAKVRVSKTDLVLRGRLHNRRVTQGKIEISYSTCAGSRTFKAAHR